MGTITRADLAEDLTSALDTEGVEYRTLDTDTDIETVQVDRAGGGRLAIAPAVAEDGSVDGYDIAWYDEGGEQTTQDWVATAVEVVGEVRRAL